LTPGADEGTGTGGGEVEAPVGRGGMRLDEAGLQRWGHRIGRLVDTPVALCLEGALGAGKSVLARAIGEGAGVEAPMPSPSFNLLFRYRMRDRDGELLHLDLYRLDRAEELWELGWEEACAEGQIVVVEWPERAGTLLPESRWLIQLSSVPGEPGLRDVAVTRVGHPPELPAFPMQVS